MKETGYAPRAVRNRDIPLLTRVLGIMQDVCSLEKRIEWQNERMYSITAHLTGMPGGKGTASGFDAVFAAVDGLQDEHREKVRTYVRELKRAEKIINSIESASMRTFVTMLYVDDLPAEFIRKELNMTRYGFERARAAVEEAESMRQVVWRERFIVEDAPKV